MEEIWKPIQGYEGLYEISNKGNVRGLDRYTTNHNGLKKVRGQLLKLNKAPTYLAVGLSNNGVHKTCLLHRLLAIHFIENPENKPEVNHKDGNKRNNELSNLEWATKSENGKHAYTMGLSSCFARTHETIRRTGIYSVCRVDGRTLYLHEMQTQ